MLVQYVVSDDRADSIYKKRQDHSTRTASSHSVFTAQVSKSCLLKFVTLSKILTMSSLKPITLYAHIQGPNPWKTAIILEELGLPIDLKIIEFSDLKKVSQPI